VPDVDLKSSVVPYFGAVESGSCPLGEVQACDDLPREAFSLWIDESDPPAGCADGETFIDVALTELIRADRIRQDVAAYLATPVTSEETAIAAWPVDRSDLADDTDWEGLYGVERA
jgi:hypothetical protein